jgi:hypothetical protein
LVTPVNVITQKQIPCIGRIPRRREKTEKIKKLAVDVPADTDRGVEEENVGLGQEGVFEAAEEIDDEEIVERIALRHEVTNVGRGHREEGINVRLGRSGKEGGH